MQQNKVLLFSFAFSLVFSLAISQTLRSMKTLMANLTSEYDKRIRPVNNQSSPISVYVDLILLSLQDLNNVEGILSIVAEIKITWNDANMIWDPLSFNNITKVFFTYNDVWVPDLVLSNSYDEMPTFGEDWQRITYTYDGSASWYVGNVMHTKCSLDLQYYPNDTQTCTISLYPRGYSFADVILHTASDQVQKHFYKDDNQWKLLRTSTKSFINTGRSSIEFTLTFSRQSNFMVFKTVVASVFFSIVNVLIFWLPPESGERISCATTIMLTFAVFQDSLDVDLPTWSGMVLLRLYLLMELYFSTLIVLATMLSTKMYLDKVPKILKLNLIPSCCYNDVEPFSDEERSASSQTTVRVRTASSQTTEQERTASSQTTEKERTASSQITEKERRRIECRNFDRSCIIIFTTLKAVTVIVFVALINKHATETQ